MREENSKIILTSEDVRGKESLEAYYKHQTDKFVDWRKVMTEHFCQDKTGWRNPVINSFTGQLNIQQFARIFLLGDYEVEKSPEEKLAEWYNETLTTSQQTFAKIILEMLELKIKGVNVQ